MSMIDDIRTAMAAAAGPVRPAEIAETLELDTGVVRNNMYAAAQKGAGIEKLDDGTYSLIPGWKSRLSDRTDEAAGDAPEPGAAAAEPETAPPPAVASRQPKPKPPAAVPPPKVQRAPAVPPLAITGGPTPDPDAITLQRSTVRTLLRFVLEQRELCDQVRDAALEAARHCL